MTLTGIHTMTSKYGYLITCMFLHAFSGSLCSSVLINPFNYSRLLAEPTELAKTRRWWFIVLWLGDLWRRESLRWQREKWCWLTWWWGPAWAPKLVPCPSKNWMTSSSLELRSFLRMRWKQHEPWVHVFFYHLHSHLWSQTQMWFGFRVLKVSETMKDCVFW